MHPFIEKCVPVDHCVWRSFLFSMLHLRQETQLCSNAFGGARARSDLWDSIQMAQNAGACVDGAMMRSLSRIFREPRDSVTYSGTFSLPHKEGEGEISIDGKIPPFSSEEETRSNIETDHHLTDKILPWLVGCEMLARNHVRGRETCKMNLIREDTELTWDPDAFHDYLKDTSVERMCTVLFEKQPTITSHLTETI